MIEEDADDVKVSAHACIFWDFHNGSWVARKKLPDGRVVQKRGPVERRMRSVGDALHGLTRDQAKQSAHDELHEWLSGSAGEPALCTASADAAFTSV